MANRKNQISSLNDVNPFLNHILKFHFWIPSYSPVPLTLTFKAIWLLASDFPEITFNVALGQ